MLNIITLTGRIVATPELRHTANGLSVTSFTLAVGRDFAKQGEERVTDFIDIVAWRSSAEFAAKYFSKGQLVTVVGTLQTRSYQDRNGVNRKAFEVIADRLYFAEGKKDSSAYAKSGDYATGIKPGAETDGDNLSTEDGSFKNEGSDFTELDSDCVDLPF